MEDYHRSRTTDRPRPTEGSIEDIMTSIRNEERKQDELVAHAENVLKNFWTPSTKPPPRIIHPPSAGDRVLTLSVVGTIIGFLLFAIFTW